MVAAPNRPAPAMSGELSAADVLSLGLSRTWYALSRALRLDRLRALLGGAQIALEHGAPVWLLGARYCVRPGAGEAEQEEVRPGAGARGLCRRQARAATTSSRQSSKALRPAADGHWGCEALPPTATPGIHPPRRRWRACCTTSSRWPG